MSTIVTRAGKGSPLTYNEVDANFTNLNTDKYQAGDSILAADLETTGNTILGNTTIDTLNVGAGGLVKDPNGNVGIGVFPSANRNFSPTLQIKNTVLNSGVSGDRTMLAYNYDRTSGNNKYISNGFASYYSQLNSVHSWHTAPSGTAENTITFTQAMTLHASGGLSIGNTTDTGAGTLNVSGLIYPQQATTAGAPAYVKGALYFDTTLNKLRVGGAIGWETITSV